MHETHNERVLESDGGALYRPWSMFDEPENQEAAMLFTFKPPTHPQVEVALRVRLVLQPTPGGGHRLARVFQLSGREARDKLRTYTGLTTGAPIDESVVDKALAEGKNPVLEILIQQEDLRFEFCQASEALKGDRRPSCR